MGLLSAMILAGFYIHKLDLHLQGKINLKLELLHIFNLDLDYSMGEGLSAIHTLKLPYNNNLQDMYALP